MKRYLLSSTVRIHLKQVISAKFSNNFTVLNPDLVICNMDSSVTLEIELTVAKGRGYIASEENKNPDANVGVIAIDSIFTPIKNVNIPLRTIVLSKKPTMKN